MERKMEKTRKHLKPILAMILAVLMMFASVAPALASGAAAVQSAAEGTQAENEKEGGTLDVDWVKITWDKSGEIVVTVRPEFGAVKGIKDDAKAILDEVIEAIKAIAVGQIKDAIEGEAGSDFDPDDPSNPDVDGVTKDSIWEMALDGYITDNYTGESPYVDFLYDLVNDDMSDKTTSTVYDFAAYVCRMAEVAYNMGIELPAPEGLKEKVLDILKEYIDKKIKEVAGDAVNSYVDKIVAGTLGTPAPGSNDAIIDDIFKSHLQTAIDACIAEKSGETVLEKGSLYPYVLDYVNAKITEKVKEFATDHLAGMKAAGDDPLSYAPGTGADYYDMRLEIGGFIEELIIDITDTAIEYVVAKAFEDALPAKPEGIDDANWQELVDTLYTEIGDASLYATKEEVREELANNHRAELVKKIVDKIDVDTVVTEQRVAEFEDRISDAAIKDAVDGFIGAGVDLDEMISNIAGDISAADQDKIIADILASNTIFEDVLEAEFGMDKATYDEKSETIVGIIVDEYAAKYADLTKEPPKTPDFRELVESINKIEITSLKSGLGGVVFTGADKSIDLGAIKDLLRDIPTLAELETMPASDMYLAYSIAISTDFGDCKASIRLEIDSDPKYDDFHKKINKAAALIRSHINLSYDGDTLVFDLIIPDEATRALVKVMNSDKIPDGIKRVAYSIIMGDLENVYDIYLENKDSFTTENIKKLITEIDVNKVLTSIADRVGVDYAFPTNEALISKVDENSSRINSAIDKAFSLIDRVYSKIPASLKEAKITDLYEKNGNAALFEIDKTVSIPSDKISDYLTDIQKKLVELVPDKYDYIITYVIGKAKDALPVDGKQMTFDLSLTTYDISKITYIVGPGEGVDGQLDEYIFEGLLPDGINIDELYWGFKTYTDSNGASHKIVGWTDADGNDIKVMPDGDVTVYAKLEALDTPLEIAPPSVDFVFDGDSRKIVANVSFDQNLFGKYPAITYEWYKDGAKVADGKELSIRDFADAGSYECRVTVSGGPYTSEVVANASAAVTAPTLSLELSGDGVANGKLEFVSGTEAQLKADITGVQLDLVQSPVYTWYVNDGASETVAGTGSTLTLTDPVEGTYYAKVSFLLGGKSFTLTSSSIDVSVTEDVVIDAVISSPDLVNGVINVVLGGDAKTVTAALSGIDESFAENLTFKWVRKVTGEADTVVSTEKTLVLDDPYEGSYLCVVSFDFNGKHYELETESFDVTVSISGVSVNIAGTNISASVDGKYHYNVETSERLTFEASLLGIDASLVTDIEYKWTTQSIPDPLGWEKDITLFRPNVGDYYCEITFKASGRQFTALSEPITIALDKITVTDSEIFVDPGFLPGYDNNIVKYTGSTLFVISGDVFQSKIIASGDFSASKPGEYSVTVIPAYGYALEGGVAEKTLDWYITDVLRVKAGEDIDEIYTGSPFEFELSVSTLAYSGIAYTVRWYDGSGNEITKFRDHKIRYFTNVADSGTFRWEVSISNYGYTQTVDGTFVVNIAKKDVTPEGSWSTDDFAPVFAGNAVSVPTFTVTNLPELISADVVLVGADRIFKPGDYKLELSFKLSDTDNYNLVLGSIETKKTLSLKKAAFDDSEIKWNYADAFEFETGREYSVALTGYEKYPLVSVVYSNESVNRASEIGKYTAIFEKFVVIDGSQTYEFTDFYYTEGTSLGFETSLAWEIVAPSAPVYNRDHVSDDKKVHVKDKTADAVLHQYTLSYTINTDHTTITLADGTKMKVLLGYDIVFKDSEGQVVSVEDGSYDVSLAIPADAPAGKKLEIIAINTPADGSSVTFVKIASTENEEDGTLEFNTDHFTGSVYAIAVVDVPDDPGPGPGPGPEEPTRVHTDTYGKVEDKTSGAILSKLTISITPLDDFYYVDAGGKRYQILAAYDIVFKNAEGNLQNISGGDFSVWIDIPESALGTEGLKVLYIDPDDESNNLELEASVDEERMKFSTSHFSIYAVAIEVQRAPDVSLALALAIGSVVLLVIITCIVVAAVKRRRKW